MEWIVSNWLALSGIAIAVVALAKAIVKVTPSTKDDEIVSVVEGVIERVLGKKPE